MATSNSTPIYTTLTDVTRPAGRPNSREMIEYHRRSSASAAYASAVWQRCLPTAGRRG
jgi:hypothetical protein